MSQLLAKVAVGMLARLVTERFLGKVVVEGCRALAARTENKFDDKIVEAMAEALGVQPELLKDIVRGG